MARFSVENEDESSVNKGNKRRNLRILEESRRKVQKFVEEEEEDHDGDNEEEEGDEAEEEMNLTNEEGDRTESSGMETGGRIAVTVDPDVIQCAICFDPLIPPLYQCQNGHVICSHCCARLHQDKCPTCCQPIKLNRCRALEKFIESMKCSCRYSKYGCKKQLPYADIESHQESCLHAPCFCPMSSCTFSGSPEKLSNHFHSHHRGLATNFQYDEHFKVSLKKNEPFHVLQEKEGFLFLLLNDRSSDKGNALSVVCIHPNPLGFCLMYELIVDGGFGSLQFKKGSTSCIKKWDGAYPSAVFLLVPHSFCSSSGQINIDVCILKRMRSFVRG